MTALYFAVVVALLGGMGLVLTLGHVAERDRLLRYLLYAGLATANVTAIPVGLAYVLLPALVETSSIELEVPGGAVAVGPLLVEVAPALGWLAIAAGTLGLLLLLPWTRRTLARLMPIDPDRPVHLVALHYAVYLTALSLMVPFFLRAMGEEGLEQLTAGSAEGGLELLWAQAVGFVVLAALGVGLFVARGPRAVLERLGLSRAFAWHWWLAGTGVAIVASVVVDGLWSVFGSESMREVERLSEALFRPYLEAGLVGALTIGLSAGIGEEILFRGAAQPRLGLLFTSVLFAVVHTQYTVSPALLQVFVVGLVLGLARKHANTTTAIGIHATYNLMLALFMIYGPGD